MMNSTPEHKQPLKALLVGVQLPKISDFEMEGSLAELSRLVTTLGYNVIGQTSQRRNSEKGSTVLGDGKLKELAKWTGGPGVVGPAVVKKKHKAALKFKNNSENSDEDELDEDADADSDSDENSGDDADADSDADADENQSQQIDPDFQNVNQSLNVQGIGNKQFDDNEINSDLKSEIEFESNSKSKTKSEQINEKIDEEIAAATKTGKAEVVIFDCDLSPSQLRNLESATGVTVLDRTGVIIEIFSRHARTRAARLQVEIARLTYVAPRLRETGGDEDRGGGGVGGKGAGETSLELDKRKIRDRIKELKNELENIAHEQDNRRARRVQEISIALVGYTNAGKSSLMRALTGSEVLVADKLFATLDTTVRLLYPESIPRILISDTVGFIKKLPHDLVASFKSTLDEALNASLLLYVVDSSDPTFRSQLAVTKSVLSEVGAEDIDSYLVLNKTDRLSADEFAQLKTEFPHALFLSAKNSTDVADLRLKLISHFETDMVDEEIMVPYNVNGAIGEIRAKMRVTGESYDEYGVTLKVRAHPDYIAKVKDRFKI